MPEKLMTLKELSDYLNIPEEDVWNLVGSGVIPAYKIGGSFLRFRKEQIDAIKNEITLKTVQTSTTSDIPQRAARKAGYKESVDSVNSVDSIGDKIIDFFYFNDFYLVSISLIIALLYVIFKM